MRFSFAVVLAFAATTLAADPTVGFNLITKPTQGENVPAGSKYQIVWQPSAAYPGAITIGLLGGASPATLSVVATIAKGVDGSAGSYSWQVPSDATLATYGITITLESDSTIFQYGFPFKITGGGSRSTVPAPVSSSAAKPDPTSSASSAAKPPTSDNPPTSSNGADTSIATSAISTSLPGPSPTVISSTSSGNQPTTVVSSGELGSSGLSRNTATISSTATSELPTETSAGTSQIISGQSSGLSSGAIAGIVVGVVLALVVLAAVAFLVVYRRRRKRNPDPSIGELDDDPRGGPQTAELADEKVKEVPELAVDAAVPATSELPSESPTRRVPELSGAAVTAPAELPLDSGGGGAATSELPSETLTRRVPELGGAAVATSADFPRDSGSGGPSFAEVSGSPLPNMTQPAVPTEGVVGDLLARQSRLDERRQRLLELEQIDQERDAIQRQLSVIQQHRQQPVQRYEMPE